MILKKRDNTFWKRFSLSFTLILVLPVAFFTLLFLKNYRRLYQDEVLKQAQNVLDGTMNELDKELENLQNIVSYNSLLAHVKSSAVIKDVTGKEIIKTLAAETATHPILEDIEYYNEERPKQLFTAKGLYSLKFYVPLWMGKTEESAYIEQFEGIEKSGWIVQYEEGYGIKRLQYVIKDENTGWWRFNISLGRLKEILHEDETDTNLLDEAGMVCYTEQSMVTQVEPENCYVLEAEAPDGIFKLTRTIDKDVLFREVEAWQNYFFLLVALALLVGGVLVLSLTWYNANPLHQLQTYYKEKVKDIPNTVKGFEVFSYAMKNMEVQLALSEKKQLKNRVLTRLIYGGNRESNALSEEMKKASLFLHTEVFRAIVIVLQKEDSYSKLGLYLSLIAEEEWEFHLPDTVPGNAAVLIVGMSKREEERLEEKLLRLAERIRKNLNDEIRFYIGERCERSEDICLSYKSAVICSRYSGQKNTEQIVYYEPDKKGDAQFHYPEEELEKLYDALINTDIERASVVTDVLLGFLMEQSQNRFVSVSLYYDVLNMYYRAQLKLEMDIDSVFLEMDILEVKDNLDAIQMILQIKEQFCSYVESVKAEAEEEEAGSLSMSGVIEYIDKNFRKSDMSVSMVADHFGMSISNLSHQFKVQRKQTILEYITEKKFEYAGELLVNTDYSVKMIAEMLSYRQSASFIRKFRQYYGITPLEYRNLNVGKAETEEWEE